MARGSQVAAGPALVPAPEMAAVAERRDLGGRRTGARPRRRVRGWCPAAAGSRPSPQGRPGLRVRNGSGLRFAVVFWFGAQLRAGLRFRPTNRVAAFSHRPRWPEADQVLRVVGVQVRPLDLCRREPDHRRVLGPTRPRVAAWHRGQQPVPLGRHPSEGRGKPSAEWRPQAGQRGLGAVRRPLVWRGPGRGGPVGRRGPVARGKRLVHHDVPGAREVPWTVSGPVHHPV
jgi:hypothetical protein